MSRDAASGPNGVFDRGLRRDASIVTHGVFPGFFAPLAGNGGAEQNRKGSHLFLDSGVNWADCDRLRPTAAQKRSPPALSKDPGLSPGSLSFGRLRMHRGILATNPKKKPGTRGRPSFCVRNWALALAFGGEGEYCAKYR